MDYEKLQSERVGVLADVEEGSAGDFDISVLRISTASDVADVLEKKVTWRERINACETLEDFLKMFDQLGVPGDKWKCSSWLFEIAKLPREKCGIGMILGGFYSVTKKRFGGFSKFVAWMEGGNSLNEIWCEKINSCKSPKE